MLFMKTLTDNPFFLNLLGFIGFAFFHWLFYYKWLQWNGGAPLSVGKGNGRADNEAISRKFSAGATRLQSLTGLFVFEQEFAFGTCTVREKAKLLEE